MRCCIHPVKWLALPSIILTISFQTQAYNESVTKMIDLFQTDSFIDPFSLTFSFSRLGNIATGVEVAPEVEIS